MYSMYCLYRHVRQIKSPEKQLYIQTIQAKPLHIH